MPIGIAISDPSPVRMRVPTIEFAIPPPASPTGAGMCVKNSMFSARMPWDTTKNKIIASGINASRTAPAQNATNSDDSALRLIIALHLGCRFRSRHLHRSRTPCHAPDQQSRQTVHNQRDDEEHET